ncbi:MAG: hypothetical protein R3E95_05465 [Thiolinea sp.]
MATLNIRNLPDDVHAALRIRAAQKGLSMEAEARHILAQVCKSLPRDRDFSKLQNLVDEMYGDRKPRHVVDDLIAERRAEAMQE